MTTSEHRLLLEMFKLQTRTFATLVEALKSQGIIQVGDLAAYDDLIGQSVTYRQKVDRSAEDAYLGFASDLGIDTGVSREDLDL